MRRATIVLLALVVVAIEAPPAGAHAGRHRTTVSEVEREVMCPTCGTTLQLASSPLADRERAFIAARVERNETKAQIKAALVAEFGESVLADPPRRGFGVAVYAVPLGGLALVAILIVIALGRWRGRGAAATRDTPSRQALDEAQAVRLDEELRRFGGL